MQDYMGILEGSNDFFKFVLLLSTNVIINASGFLPSAFLTTINLSLYGTFYGTLLSFFGEVVGTQIGFHLYKIGISKIKPSWLKHPFWDKLQSSSVRSVIISIISLRLLPFVPSGLVTAGAALTTIGTWTFMMASTIGKIPSVVIEVAIINGLLQTFNLSFSSLYFIFLFLVLVISLVRIGKTMFLKK